jgi:hypothetical protein
MCGRKSVCMFSQPRSLLRSALVALALSSFLALPMSAQEQSESSTPTLGDMIETASSLSTDSQLLMQRLSERKKQANEQAARSASTAQASKTLSPQADQTQSAISDSQTASTVTSSYAAASQSAASDLKADFETYKNDSTARIKTLELELRVYKDIGISLGCTLGAVGLYEGGRALKLW